MQRFLVAAALLSVSIVANAQSLRPDHPIIGSWKLTLPNSSCYEVYLFRANGTTLVTSGEDIGESEFTVSDQPSPKGFYKWVDRIVKDNGKKDCVGETMVIGDVVTKYLRFKPSGDMFLICDTEDLKSCIGPLVKVKGSDA